MRTEINLMTGEIVTLPDAPTTPLTADEIYNGKWVLVDNFVSSLTITSSFSHTFAANSDSLLEIGKRIMNPTPSTSIVWDEKWGQFITSTVELQEVYSEAMRQIQAYKDSIFGVPV